MTLHFEELDAITRGYMAQEFEGEQRSNHPYLSLRLSTIGRLAFPGLMRAAIQSGDEDSLRQALLNATYWQGSESYTTKSGYTASRAINVHQAAESLGQTEFNTWYVRGLAKRLLDEGTMHCEIYRAGYPKWSPAECSIHEGRVVLVSDVYNGHRARYWPTPGNPRTFSIPFGPGCHHSIRRR